jgi:myo-inositol-1(or 4)-monophosphatase
LAPNPATLCATSLALLHDERPVLGVIDAPFLGQRYHAVEGYGAYSGVSRLAASRTAQLRVRRLRGNVAKQAMEL